MHASLEQGFVIGADHWISELHFHASGRLHESILEEAVILSPLPFPIVVSGFMLPAAQPAIGSKGIVATKGLVLDFCHDGGGGQPSDTSSGVDLGYQRMVIRAGFNAFFDRIDHLMQGYDHGRIDP